MPTFAERLHELRAGKGLSQYALAQQSGLSKQALSLLEKGTREPSWATVQAICRALGVDCREFQELGPEAPGVGPDAAQPKRGRPPKQAEAQAPAEPPGVAPAASAPKKASKAGPPAEAVPDAKGKPPKGGRKKK